ncbi:MAG: branched-chain amino acid ABC transporter substrate-binding protein [Rhodopila sp.]
MTQFFRGIIAVPLLLAALLFGQGSRAEDTIKIGYIDPLSGAFAQQGDASLQHFAYLLDLINAQGSVLGKKLEIVPYDSKLQPAEALIALNHVIDQNIPFVMQCAGSNVGAALLDGVSKHNARNPDHRILYLNCGALASDLTNEKCDFWHFRFDANTAQRAATLVRALPKSVATVYLLNQDYLFGQTLQRETKEQLATLRPDIKIVGEEFIPLGKVKDFSSYVEKIRDSKAQVLITGNWGPDLNLMLKAAVDTGLPVEFYTYLSHVVGAPTATGSAGENRLNTVVEFHPNVPNEEGSAAGETFVANWRKGHNFDLFQMNNYVMLKMLAAAINKAGTTDPLQVALALEGMQATDVMGHDYMMRKDDHQLMEPLYVAKFTRDVKYDSEGTGLGWKTIGKSDAASLVLPTTCRMKRPQS